MQLKFDSIRTGVALYSNSTLKLNSFRWSSNLLFLYDSLSRNKRKLQHQLEILMLILAKRSRVCKLNRLLFIVQNYVENRSFADSLIDQFDWIRQVWLKSESYGWSFSSLSKLTSYRKTCSSLYSNLLFEVLSTKTWTETIRKLKLGTIAKADFKMAKNRDSLKSIRTLILLTSNSPYSIL